MIIFAFIFGAYLARLLSYYPKAYVDDYWLVETSVAEDPSAWYGWFMRAFKRAKQKAYKEALNLFVMAKLLSPQEFKILYNIGILLKLFKQDKEADHYLDLAQKYIIRGQETTSNHLLKLAREGKGQLIK